MTTIKVKYKGLTRNIVGKDSEDQEVPDTFTLGDLLSVLSTKYGDDFSQRLLDSSGHLTGDVILAVDGAVVNDLGYKLGQEGASVEVAIIPELAGGTI